MPANAVNVSRSGKLGNPFVVGVDGSREECVGLYARMLRTGPIEGFSASLAHQEAARAHLIANIDDLRGRDLACWCALDGEPCHGDVQLTVVNAERLPVDLSYWELLAPVPIEGAAE